ncbi:MAG: TIM barrel protein [Candidatus Latescibacterota bacterium]|jgi:sugar phosphate isomerase/epimerase
MTLRIATTGWEAPLEVIAAQAAQAGYEGLQWGVPAGSEGTLKTVLDRHGLKLAASCAGGTFLDPATRQQEIDEAVAEARRLKALGAEVLEMMCGLRPVGGPSESQLLAYADGLNEVGRRCRELGVRVGVHNHGVLFLESQTEIDFLYRHLDPELVGTGFDTGHLALAGMDAAAVFRQYAGRTAYVHLKDLFLVDRPAGESDRVMAFDEVVSLAERSDLYTWLVLRDLDGRQLVLGGGKLGHDYLRDHRELIRGVRCCDLAEYQFAEIGHGGLVDFPSVLAALEGAGFDGWLAVELDVSYRTRYESARMSREHLRSLGV